jgi:predicted 3-demethylubiquinone-9 3-methyltransferase (glyoxalase superfamily)
MPAADVIPFIWFDDDLEEALASYERIFGDLRREADQLDPSTGELLAVRFEIAGRRVMGLQGGPGHPHTDALSLFVLVEGGQDEVDRIWDGCLAEGGTEVACGWLTDRFGLSWQVTPTRLPELLQDPDPARAQRAMQAMMKQVKIDIAEIERAADGS